MRHIIALTAVFVLVLSGPAEAAWERVEPERADYVQNCVRVKTGYFDPIVYPGQNNVAHNHTFFGNLSISPSSNQYTLGASGTNCELSRNHSSYWVPTFYANGVPVYPGNDRFELRVYYRGGTTNLASVKPIPYGWRYIAGNPNATSPQSAGVAGYQCRNLTQGNTVAKQSLPPNCAPGDYLEASIVFPNCIDGRLDSPHHKAHAVYRTKDQACPSTHPTRIPRVTMALRFPTGALYNKKLTLATNVSKTGGDPNSARTLHADDMFAWAPRTQQELINRCIKQSILCEGVRDDRLPPGMVLPPDDSPTQDPATFRPVQMPRGFCHVIVGKTV